VALGAASPQKFQRRNAPGPRGCRRQLSSKAGDSRSTTTRNYPEHGVFQPADGGGGNERSQEASKRRRDGRFENQFPAGRQGPAASGSDAAVGNPVVWTQPLARLRPRLSPGRLTAITPCIFRLAGAARESRPRTPTTIFNRPGLSAISYRVGAYAQFKVSMLACYLPAQ